MSATFKVSFAGPLASFQDSGRFGKLRFGVPASGPMDRFGFAASHAILGQEPKTGIEISRGGIILECLAGNTHIAQAGGAFSILKSGVENKGWTVLPVHAGDKISIRAGEWGSWGYLSFAGDLVAPGWLGSCATHSLSGLGGGILRAGDEFSVENLRSMDARIGEYNPPEIAKPKRKIDMVLGPQERHFDPEAITAIEKTSFKVTDAYDRMGMRLDGPKLKLGDALSIPSEPVIRGSVQVSGDGVPTILLADHQTTGGYPKIATIASYELDRLAQSRAGDVLQFNLISSQEAILRSRKFAQTKVAELNTLGMAPIPLADRLMQMNLISGYNA